MSDWPTSQNHARYISNWLFGVCTLIFIMIILGGLTRLTHSGLSMVNWQPFTGWLPPMNDIEWKHSFNLYKNSPEFLQINFNMSLNGFKNIFWLEFIHRVFGRIIGLAFLIPFVFFMCRGWVDRRSVPILFFLLMLGAVQGILGWYMVQSGLIDKPDVSQYRLTAHLGLAVLIYVLMFRLALRLRLGFDAVIPIVPQALYNLRIFSRILPFVIFLTLLSGGVVAGIDGGLTYNTFPLMDGKIVPIGLYDDSSPIFSIFEDVLTVQFNHRVLAIGTLLLIFLFWLLSFKMHLTKGQRWSTNFLFVISLCQVLLGISTLVMVVPVGLAIAHQTLAILLLTTALFLVHQMEWGTYKNRLLL